MEMDIVFEDWEVTGEGYWFVVKMPVIPRIGEEIYFTKEMINPKFFTDRYLGTSLELNDIDGWYVATVKAVQYYIRNHVTRVEIDLEFLTKDNSGVVKVVS